LLFLYAGWAFDVGNGHKVKSAGGEIDINDANADFLADFIGAPVGEASVTGVVAARGARGG